MAITLPCQGRDRGSTPLTRSKYGAACTKAGEKLWQSFCEGFDFLLLHSLLNGGACTKAGEFDLQSDCGEFNSRGLHNNKRVTHKWWCASLPSWNRAGSIPVTRSKLL